LRGEWTISGGHTNPHLDPGSGAGSGGSSQSVAAGKEQISKSRKISRHAATSLGNVAHSEGFNHMRSGPNVWALSSRLGLSSDLATGRAVGRRQGRFPPARIGSAGQYTVAALWGSSWRGTGEPSRVDAINASRAQSEIDRMPQARVKPALKGSRMTR
jgi:hypothetical protein